MHCRYSEVVVESQQAEWAVQRKPDPQSEWLKHDNFNTLSWLIIYQNIVWSVPFQSLLGEIDKILQFLQPTQLQIEGDSLFMILSQSNYLFVLSIKDLTIINNQTKDQLLIRFNCILLLSICQFSHKSWDFIVISSSWSWRLLLYWTYFLKNKY